MAQNRNAGWERRKSQETLNLRIVSFTGNSERYTMQRNWRGARGKFYHRGNRSKNKTSISTRDPSSASTSRAPANQSPIVVSVTLGTESIWKLYMLSEAPNFCIDCRSGMKFEPLQSSPYTVTMDWQVAKIQEIQSQAISGTIPRSVEIELHGDLVGTACPGDVLSVTGIVQVRGESKGGEDGRRAARLLQLYIEVVSVHSHRNLSNPTLSFTLKDYYAIQEIHGSENVLKLLVHSLCPSIFGHEMVKAGLILGLMGGTEIENGPRSNPHVLIVGDPGLGKSQLLQAAAHAAPRGVYVCGASASAGGLTVALGREAGGDFALEAGALVLADKGVCCVDELDKMSAHHSSLLEAMEQRRVSVAKAGVVCSLAARATVLAAANPATGSYSKSKTVSENLKLNSALLSRFDLVFILLDQPDEKTDAMLSEHVLALHFGQKAKGSTNKNLLNLETNSNIDGDLPLSKRLRLKRGEVIDTLPMALLRKYIAYARRYVHPKLSQEAANALKAFYLDLRTNSQGGTPITTRQLEACIRLSQARARVDLREEATENDANDVINLMKYSLIDTFSDEFGNIQLSRSINGSGVSSRSKLKRFLEALTLRAQQTSKNVFTRKEMLQIHREAGVPGDANDLIEAMHVHSYLLLKASNTYQLIT
ncbi:DNA helicase MCM8 [Eumeta japonica]|uniref:DNA helicase n=1 Tax=Eumeta variegata TaxID=151549 RepID=A0A4C1UPI9_EUMVA|nr:DNA helicase MCM8 [Eumeta japonica]